MGDERREHRANEDEADRHARTRHVPAWVAIVVAILILVALAYLGTLRA
jgi:hypothetical protein